MLLLHANRTVPTARMVDALWPDGALRTARGQLHGCISRLRKHLASGSMPADVIVTDPAGYRVHVDQAAVDLLEFRALITEARAAVAESRDRDARDGYRAALALWRGPALAGLEGQPVQQAAARLDEEHAQALEEYVNVELALGAAGTLVGELTELVREHPYREGLHAALMLALYRAGRQADALAAYQRVRHTLITDLGQEPGPALRQLQQRILAGDVSLRLGEPGGAASPRPASHHLPRTLNDFTGRDADLVWLTEAASQAAPYAPLVLAVDGMPGIGKTSLAVRAGHLLKDRFPDGQLFIDLHGHSEHRPVEPADALATLLRQLGMPQSRIGTDLDDRRGQWHAELATRRVLVVLDNAASSGQVTPLLPTSAGCLALVTSRRRLVDLDGARPHSIDPLTQEEAVTLLERVAGPRVREEPAATAEVAKRCGHLPLALLLAAARLAHRPSWRVRDLADRLSDLSAPLTELSSGDRTVTDTFAMSYEQLAPTSQRMFRLLGLHPGEHFDTRTAAALTDLSLPDAERALDELVEGHLVQELHADRYRLHDLIRSYAYALARAHDLDADCNVAIEGLLDYYLHAAAAASASLETPNSRRNFQPGIPKRPDLVDGRYVCAPDWLEAERLNLVAAVRCAEPRGMYVHTWQISRAIWQFLQLQGYTDDLVDTHTRSLAAAESLGDMNAAATMRNYLAWAHSRVGDHEKAVEYAEQTLRDRQRMHDRIGVAISQRNLATVYAEAGRRTRAMEHCLRALAAARGSDDLDILATTVANAGHIYLTLGQYGIALRHSRHGLLLAREVGDQQLSALALGNVGLIRARLGHWEPAFRILLAALKERRRAGTRHGEAETLNGLGAVYRAFGSYARALDHHKQALDIVQEAGYHQTECAVRNEYGQTLRAAGDRAAAREQHQLALDRATKIKHRCEQARALDGIAACLRDADPDAARRHWLRARQLYQELHLPERRDVERALAALPTRS